MTVISISSIVHLSGWAGFVPAWPCIPVACNREATAILDLSLRQTLEIVEKKIGGNVGREEACRALELAEKLAEK